jgi:hypothetical protein
MLLNEAKWINNIIASHLNNFNGTAVNLGSSSLDFIKYNQPYIENLVLKPISKNFKLINVDVKVDSNIQLVADFLTDSGQKTIKEQHAKVFLVSNLLEHIPAALDGINQLKKLVESNSYIILTGPKSFPYHPDPIDNMFRPKLREIYALFEKDFEIIELVVVKNGTVFSSSLFGRSVKKTGKVLQSKGGLLRLIFNTSFLYKTIRNMFYPASAFCMLARKK